jgi:hypothetical protein
MHTKICLRRAMLCRSASMVMSRSLKMSAMSSKCCCTPPVSNMMKSVAHAESVAHDGDLVNKRVTLNHDPTIRPLSPIFSSSP